jgi:hypothetical protein
MEDAKPPLFVPLRRSTVETVTPLTATPQAVNR